MDVPILDRFGYELAIHSVTQCCSLSSLCDFHRGFIAGIDEMIKRVNLELAKLGWSPLDG